MNNYKNLKKGELKKMDKMQTVQNLTNQIDTLQADLERTSDPITAMILSKKYNELEELGFDYNVFNKELIFIF